MPHQLTDEQMAYYTRQDNIAKFVDSIWTDPQLSKEAKALAKKKYPQLEIPDYDIRAEMDQRFQQEREEREKVENERRERSQRETFEQARTQTKEKYGFTDEAMTDLEKFMVERNIGDYEVAASYRAARNPKPSDATFDDQRWNHSKQEGFAEIVKDPEAWGRAEIMKAIRNDEQREKGGRF
jgi:hypothetical protein